MIKIYYHQGYNNKEILAFLDKYHGKKLSYRQLLRLMKGLKIKRKYFDENLSEIIETIVEELKESGSCLGYRSLWHRLRVVYGLQVKRETVLDILRELDPEGIEKRSRYRLKRRRYSVKGPNSRWHLDGYDKVKPFGFAIHGAVDGFSRKILWLQVATTNKDPDIISHFYLKALKKFNCIPRTVRTDKGTENPGVECLQISLRYDDSDDEAGYKSYFKGRSVHNQRIEKQWGLCRILCLDYWINLFKDMQDSGELIEDSHVCWECLRYCFADLIQADLDLMRMQWNRHAIRKQKIAEVVTGKPNSMYYLPELFGHEDQGKPVDEEHIKMCLEEYSIPHIRYDPTFEELAELLLPRHEKPENVESAKNLYKELCSLLKLYDED